MRSQFPLANSNHRGAAEAATFAQCKPIRASCAMSRALTINSRRFNVQLKPVPVPERTVAEIARLLKDLRNGDADAMGALFELLYPELRQLAARQIMVAPGHTLTPTVLVNETFLKLFQADNLDLVDRRHFMICTAKAMRQIAIDHARARGAKRRGGDQQRVSLTGAAQDVAVSDLDLLDLDRALDDLQELDPDLRQLVELKFFAGQTLEEVANLLQTSLRSVNRDWARARAFLHTQLA